MFEIAKKGGKSGVKGAMYELSRGDKTIYYTDAKLLNSLGMIKYLSSADL